MYFIFNVCMIYLLHFIFILLVLFLCLVCAANYRKGRKGRKGRKVFSHNKFLFLVRNNNAQISTLHQISPCNNNAYSHTCQPPQQRRASEGRGIKAIFRASGGWGGPFNHNFNISLGSTENRKAQSTFNLIWWECDTKRQGGSQFYFLLSVQYL